MLRLVCSMCAALNSARAKLSYSSFSSSTVSSARQLFLPPPLFFYLSASAQLTILSFSQSRLSPPCCLSPSFILSHPFLHLFVAFTPSPPCPPLSFCLALCPSPSLLIRTICWRGRQRDLRMDKIVLYVQSVVQCRRQPCVYMRPSVARIYFVYIVFVFECVHACSHV